MEAEVTTLQEKVQSLETLTEHLNDVKFEDFAKRFRKEIIENSDNQISSLTKEIKVLDDKKIHKEK